MKNNLKEILSVGVPLQDIGVNNWALTKEQALDALDKLEALKISVLGGDMYRKTTAFYPTYEIWSIKKQKDESDDAFVKRSIDRARIAINGYYQEENDPTYFLLTTNVTNEAFLDF